MQATTRLHPLLAAAAVSLIVLSGVGVAAMTGLISLSKGQEPALELSKEIVTPLEPAISHPPAANPKPKRTAAKKPAAPAVYREYSEIAPVARGTLTGFGVYGYYLALKGLQDLCVKK